jgi:murein DD-endopeptidase MepM/ murein hydrolase activator NlpD
MTSKKIFISIIALLVFLSSFNIVYADVNSDLKVKDLIDSYNHRLTVIQQLQGQETALQGQLSAINRQVFEYDKLAKELQPAIDKVTSNMKSIQKSIADTQKTIDSRNNLFKNRLSTMYSSGNISVSYMEVLLASTDFSDFINRITMLTMIIRQDKQTIDTMTEEKAKLSSMNVELQQQQNLLLVQQNTLHAAKAEQEKIIKDRLTILDQLQQQSHNEVGIAQKEAEDLSTIDAQLTPDVEAQLKATLEKKITSDGVWDWPVPSSHLVTSDFGPRGNGFHAGIDIGAPIGTSIVAVDNGVVLYSGTASGFGHWVVIKHSDGLMSVYGHMYGDGIFVSVGQEVKRGQVIAVVGADGQSTGPHLHFAVATGITGNQMNYIDPRPFLNNEHL